MARKQGLVPYLTVDNAQSAIVFYNQAFGANQIGIALTDPDERIMHVELEIESSRMMLAEHLPEFGTHEPLSLGGTPVRMSLEVENADSTVDRAIEFGAELVVPVDDQFHGQRSGRIVDPFGHIWVVSHAIEDVTREEMQDRLTSMFEADTN